MDHSTAMERLYDARNRIAELEAHLNEITLQPPLTVAALRSHVAKLEAALRDIGLRADRTLDDAKSSGRATLRTISETVDATLSKST